MPKNNEIPPEAAETDEYSRIKKENEELRLQVQRLESKNALLRQQLFSTFLSLGAVLEVQVK